jgi:hypothetical protein
MAKRYQRGNQKTGIKERHTIQCPKDTNEAIRRQESKKDIQYNGQKIPKRQSEDRNQRNTYNTMAKRYQRGNQKTGIKERHTMQWPKDTKEAIRRQESKRDIQYNAQKIPKRQSEDRNQRKTYNTMAKRYQRGNQKTGIKETHTIQWPKDTKEAIRRQESKKDIQYNDQKIPKRQSEDRNQRKTYNTMVKRYQIDNQKTGIKERYTIQWPKDTKEAIRRQESKKHIQCNGQKISKRQSEDRNQRKTYNTMTKRYQRGS